MNKPIDDDTDFNDIEDPNSAHEEDEKNYIEDKYGHDNDNDSDDSDD